MRTYRRFIRYGGKLIASPKFDRKVDAEEWYHQMRRKRNFLKDGIDLPSDDNTITFLDYSREWFQRRLKNFPKSTTYSDEQRLRDYLLPNLSEIPINQISTDLVKKVLTKIMEPDYKEGVTLSRSTRDRVKALLSSIMTDALNESPPLIKFNPVHNIKFSEKRKGKPKPRVLGDREECLKFIESAKELGELEFSVACLFLMTGMRKQELIALRWACVDLKGAVIEVREKYEQVSNLIIVGTKAGEETSRSVPISKELVKVLTDLKKKTPFKEPQHFVISKPNGRHYTGRAISSIIERIREKAKVNISAHGLRHTYGREFALNTGNIKALQAILGHTTSATTDIYSNLSGKRIEGFGEAVSFQKSVKRSEK